MKNKKGFVRTLEAVIAIILLLSIVYMVTPERKFDISTPNKIEQAHTVIFSEVSLNQSFRNCILPNNLIIGAINNAEGQYTGTVISNSCLDPINNFIELHRPNGYVYLAEVCNKSASCLDSNLPIDKSIFAESILLASDDPKVFRVYFWER